MSRDNGGQTIRKTPWRYMLSGMTRNKALASFALILVMTSTLLTVFPSVFIGRAVTEILASGALTALFMYYVWLIVFFALIYKGLYFVGASTFPGAGIESAVVSASICANDIRGWKPAQ